MQGGDACTELSTIRADTCFAGVWHLPARMKSQNLESIAAETSKTVSISRVVNPYAARRTAPSC